VHSVLRLRRPLDKEEKDWKTYSHDDLKDLQSKIMLVARQDDLEEGQPEEFIQVGHDSQAMME
jgi:hypothetical protein